MNYAVITYLNSLKTTIHTILMDTNGCYTYPIYQLCSSTESKIAQKLKSIEIRIKWELDLIYLVCWWLISINRIVFFFINTWYKAIELRRERREGIQQLKTRAINKKQQHLNHDAAPGLRKPYIIYHLIFFCSNDCEYTHLYLWRRLIWWS